jgi:ribonuclease P protein component
LVRLKTRADYLRAQKGQRQSAKGLGIEVCASPDQGSEGACVIRVGITASRKTGGAVERNRAKRRLRAAAAAVLPLSARPGRDYVLIARKETLVRPFAKLVDDLQKAVAAADAAMDRKANRGKPDSTRPQNDTEEPRF